MNCPRCSDKLKTIEYENVKIETCGGCEGEWLDDSELKQLVQTVEETFPQEMKDSLDAINKNIFTIDESADNQLTCPKCPDIELNRINYASSSGIALDKCPDCGGIWFDKDEIEQVQILVEEWQATLEEDTKKFAPVLDRIKAEGEVQDKKASQISRFGFINAILRGITQHS